jgi:hypothetical protein
MQRIVSYIIASILMKVFHCCTKPLLGYLGKELQVRSNNLLAYVLNHISVIIPTLDATFSEMGVAF